VLDIKFRTEFSDLRLWNFWFWGLIYILISVKQLTLVWGLIYILIFVKQLTLGKPVAM